jgi:hypothetical protein
MTADAPSKEAPVADLAEPNLAWSRPADAETVERTAEALRDKGYEIHVVDDGDAARAVVLGKLPEGAEVSQGASITLEDTGITAAIEGSGRFEAIRPKTRALDYKTEEGRRQGRRMGAAPDYWINSAHALTEDGRLVIASNTGSQLGPIAFGAGEVIFVIGAQKIVPDLESALRRIEEYSLPLESARLFKLHGVPSAVNKILIVNKEYRPGRFTIVLVREAVGS